MIFKDRYFISKESQASRNRVKRFQEDLRKERERLKLLKTELKRV